MTALHLARGLRMQPPHLFHHPTTSNCWLPARELIASREAPFKRDRMPKFSAKPKQFRCPACKGTGFPAVKQPAQPGRKIYPARCERCDGKGWVEAARRG